MSLQIAHERGFSVLLTLLVNKPLDSTTLCIKTHQSMYRHNKARLKNRVELLLLPLLLKFYLSSTPALPG